jgi:hypothetical protein
MDSKNTEKEIDIIDLGKSISSFIYNSANNIVQLFKFLKRKALVIFVILVGGFAAGYGLDEFSTKYKSQVIVSSNFESVDYLYNTVALINSKIKQNDKKFLQKIGIKNTNQIISLEVEPIIDVYKFVTNNPQNFEMIKLFSESGDAQSTIKDLVTSKNYSSHQILLTTDTNQFSDQTIKSILKYLNSNKYYNDLRIATLKNIDFKLASNQQMIGQIDQILQDFSKNTQNNSKSGDKLVYYNDNTQLNDIITTRNNLVITQGSLEIEKAAYDKFIKDTSTSLNIKDTKSITSKLKIVVPALALCIYFFALVLVALSKKARQ